VISARKVAEVNTTEFAVPEDEAAFPPHEEIDKTVSKAT